MKRLAGVLIIGILVMAGCSATHVYRISQEKFPPKPPGAEIELYIGKVKRPHKEIAVIDSRSLGSKDDEAKKQQLDDLKEIARKLGADAVHNIRLLRKRARGMVPDERVPFPAWKQGEYNLFFLRGEAIKFITAQMQPEQEQKSESTIPESESKSQ